MKAPPLLHLQEANSPPLPNSLTRTIINQRLQPLHSTGSNMNTPKRIPASRSK
jgi:hypothetical protein